MKLTKALSLVLAFAMVLGTFVIGVTAAVDEYDTVLYPDLHQTGTAGLNGYQAIDEDDRANLLPETVYTMTEFVESGKTVSAFANDVTKRNFTISSPEEMIMFSEKVNSGEPFYMAKIFLTKDIVFADGQTMAPIGNWLSTADRSPTVYFRGDFNGCGFAIKNLHMTSNAAGVVNVALFGCIRGAVIQNLVIDSSCSFTYTGTSADARVASVAAYALTIGEDGAGADSNTEYNPGGASGAKYGVASYMQYAESYTEANTRLPVTYLVKNVKNCAPVSSTTSVAGGIVGAHNGATGYYGLIMQCTQAADVTASVYAAGILGKVINRGVRVIECQVKSDANVPVKITGDVVDARTNRVGGDLDVGNFGDFAAAELRDTTEGFDYDVRGYSFKNVMRVNTASMPRISAYASNTSAKEFKVINADDMLAIATLVNGGNKLKGVTIYLANDIDWASDENKNVTMVTIGGNPDAVTPQDNDGATADYRDSANYFSGTFDGQGYVIDNLKMSFTTNFGGLFGLLRNGTVKNMVLGYGCEFYSTGKWVAPIAMLHVFGSETSQVINCFNAATVTKPEKNVASGMVATVAGNTNAAYAKVLYCTNAGKITAGWTVGAMVGYAARPIFVNYCVNTGELEATNGAGDEVGAMVGAAHAGGQFIYNLSTTLPKYLETKTPFDTFFGTRNGSWIQTGNISEGSTESEQQEIFANWTAPIHYAGYQTQTVNGKVTAIRLLATVNDLSALNVGFNLTLDGTIQAEPITTTTVYGSVLANAEGVNVTIQSETLGGKYIVAITINDIPTNETHTITVQTTQNGEAVGAAKDIVIANAG